MTTTHSIFLILVFSRVFASVNYDTASLCWLLKISKIYNLSRIEVIIMIYSNSADTFNSPFYFSSSESQTQSFVCSSIQPATLPFHSFWAQSLTRLVHSWLCCVGGESKGTRVRSLGSRGQEVEQCGGRCFISLRLHMDSFAPGPLASHVCIHGHICLHRT